MGNEVKIKLSQIYLEMARSFVYSTVHSKSRNDELKDEENADDRSTFYFGMASLSTLYSYMAIETYINHLLYELWQQSRSANKLIEKLNNSNPNLKAVPNYNDFYNKYGILDDFKEIRKTKLKELKERIKIICKEYNYPLIHEVKPQLWTDFTGILENVRHFLIHPNPDEEEFQKYSKTLIQDKSLYNKYPEIATQIISHFYISANRELPAYLTSNQIFLINEIILLK